MREDEVLKARQDAIERYLKEQRVDPADKDPIVGACVMLAKEAVGRGFDEGIKYAAAKMESEKK